MWDELWVCAVDEIICGTNIIKNASQLNILIGLLC